METEEKLKNETPKKNKRKRESGGNENDDSTQVDSPAEEEMDIVADYSFESFVLKTVLNAFDFVSSYELSSSNTGTEAFSSSSSSSPLSSFPLRDFRFVDESSIYSSSYIPSFVAYGSTHRMNGWCSTLLTLKEWVTVSEPGAKSSKNKKKNPCFVDLTVKKDDFDLTLHIFGRYSCVYILKLLSSLNNLYNIQSGSIKISLESALINSSQDSISWLPFCTVLRILRICNSLGVSVLKIMGSAIVRCMLSLITRNKEVYLGIRNIDDEKNFRKMLKMAVSGLSLLLPNRKISEKVLVVDESVESTVDHTNTIKESVFTKLITFTCEEIRSHTCAFCGDGSGSSLLEKEFDEVICFNEEDIRSAHYNSLIYSLLVLTYCIRYSPTSITLSFSREVGSLVTHKILLGTKWMTETNEFVNTSSQYKEV
jgi:hypothetical protein